MGTSFTWNMFLIHTPIFTNVNRGYILGEIHRVSTQILDENACTILSIISNLQQKIKKQSPKYVGFHFFVIIIANIDLAYWRIYLICTL